MAHSGHSRSLGLCRQVLFHHLDELLALSDSHHVFTTRIVDILFANGGIQLNQKQKIESETLPQERFKVLLDIVSSEGMPAFDKLCDALKQFGTEEKMRMAKLLEDERDLIRDDTRGEQPTERASCAVEYFDNHHPQQHQQLREKLHQQQFRQLEERIRDLERRLDESEAARAKLDESVTKMAEQIRNLEMKAFDKRKLSRETFIDNSTKDDGDMMSVTGDKAMLVETIDEENAIGGFTILNSELLVYYFGNIEITVYDIATYGKKTSILIADVGNVASMTACEELDTFYMADDHRNVVYAVEKKTNKINIACWDVRDKPAGLAVSSSKTILVTFSDASKVEEYTTDGTFKRTVPLDPSIVHPRHAHTLADGQLIVCHGSADDLVNRVCAVDSTGQIVHSYGFYRGQGRGLVKTPTRLAGSSNVYVSDLNNKRIVLLSPTLDHRCVVVSGLSAPYRLWLDEQADRLYVADNTWHNNSWVAGKLNVYNISGVNRSHQPSFNIP